MRDTLTLFNPSPEEIPDQNAVANWLLENQYSSLFELVNGKNVLQVCLDNKKTALHLRIENEISKQFDAYKQALGFLLDLNSDSELVKQAKARIEAILSGCINLESKGEWLPENVILFHNYYAEKCQAAFNQAKKMWSGADLNIQDDIASFEYLRLLTRQQIQAVETLMASVPQLTR
ncbi:MAG TPA: hypothetical protein VHZ76_09850 [Gammaproteobacteria bacterium]|jgi:hypothetical protein|nr:hypothetical protein [Gammaproteobacteria bacterium]